MTFEEQIRQSQIDDRIAEFAMACVATAVGASGGRVLAIEDDVREFVRLGRDIYDEIKQPTPRPEPEESPVSRQEHPVGDLTEGFWLPEEGV